MILLDIDMPTSCYSCIFRDDFPCDCEYLGENCIIKCDIESIKEEIEKIKSERWSENTSQSYKTAYICALSAVEGILAEAELGELT